MNYKELLLKGFTVIFILNNFNWLDCSSLNINGIHVEIEKKMVCSDIHKFQKRLEDLGVDSPEKIEQNDTYFLKAGCLKLVEVNKAVQAKLVKYVRLRKETRNGKTNTILCFKNKSKGNGISIEDEVIVTDFASVLSFLKLLDITEEKLEKIRKIWETKYKSESDIQSLFEECGLTKSISYNKTRIICLFNTDEGGQIEFAIDKVDGIDIVMVEAELKKIPEIAKNNEEKACEYLEDQVRKLNFDGILQKQDAGFNELILRKSGKKAMKIFF